MSHLPEQNAKLSLYLCKMYTYHQLIKIYVAKCNLGKVEWSQSWPAVSQGSDFWGLIWGFAELTCLAWMAKNTFGTVAGHVDWPNQFQLARVSFLTGQNIENIYSEECPYFKLIEKLLKAKILPHIHKNVLLKSIKISIAKSIT